MKEFIEYVICEKCNTVCNKFSVIGHYEMNNTAYTKLEFICKCKNIINAHISSKLYYNYIQDIYNKVKE